MPTHTMNTSDDDASFIEIPSLAREITSRGVGVNGRTDGQPENTMLSYYCMRRHKNV